MNIPIRNMKSKIGFELRTPGNNKKDVRLCIRVSSQFADHVILSKGKIDAVLSIGLHEQLLDGLKIK